LAKQDAQTYLAEAKQEKTRADANFRRFGKDLYVGEIRLAQTAWDEARIHRLSELLDGLRPQRMAGADLRGFEWHYLQRLCHADRFTIAEGGIGVAYSPDGKYLAATGGNGMLTIHDAATGKPLHRL